MSKITYTDRDPKKFFLIAFRLREKKVKRVHGLKISITHGQ